MCANNTKANIINKDSILKKTSKDANMDNTLTPGIKLMYRARLANAHIKYLNSLGITICATTAYNRIKECENLLDSRRIGRRRFFVAPEYSEINREFIKTGAVKHGGQKSSGDI